MLIADKALTKIRQIIKDKKLENIPMPMLLLENLRSKDKQLEN
jgi:hypothetical protein